MISAEIAFTSLTFDKSLSCVLQLKPTLHTHILLLINNVLLFMFSHNSQVIIRDCITKINKRKILSLKVSHENDNELKI